MKNPYKRFWIIAVLSIVVMCWGVWVMIKQRSLKQQTEFNYIDYLPEVSRAHENYATPLNVDTFAILIIT